MELKELIELKELNELDLLYKLIKIAEGSKRETEDVLRKNKAAGIRVREKMQDIRLLCEIIRDKIQERKGMEKSTLEKEIATEEQRIIKERILINKRKQERINKLKNNKS